MNETADEFESFRRALVADMAPQGELEQALAERIAIGFWRRRRVPMFEAALYRRGFHELIVERESTTCRRLELSQCERTSALLFKKEVAQYDRAVFQEAANRLGQAQAALDETIFDYHPHSRKVRSHLHQLVEAMKLMSRGPCTKCCMNYNDSRRPAPESRSPLPQWST
jgi:hypothetical protein